MLPGRPGKILVFITCFGKQSHGFSWGNQEAHSQDRPTLPSWDHVPRRGTSVGACHPPLDHHTSPPGCGSPTCCSCWPWSLAPGPVALRPCLGVTEPWHRRVGAGPLHSWQHRWESSGARGWSLALLCSWKEIQL